MQARFARHVTRGSSVRTSCQTVCAEGFLHALHFECMAMIQNQHARGNALVLEKELKFNAHKGRMSWQSQCRWLPWGPLHVAACPAFIFRWLQPRRWVWQHGAPPAIQHFRRVLRCKWQYAYISTERDFY